VDIARYRATLQALTEARHSAAAAQRGHVDDAEREQWLWIAQLLDSIERSARRALRETIIIDTPRMSRR
jgi:hypothetical protein